MALFQPFECHLEGILELLWGTFSAYQFDMLKKREAACRIVSSVRVPLVNLLFALRPRGLNLYRAFRRAVFWDIR